MQIAITLHQKSCRIQDGHFPPPQWRKVHALPLHEHASFMHMPDKAEHILAKRLPLLVKLPAPRSPSPQLPASLQTPQDSSYAALRLQPPDTRTDGDPGALFCARGQV